MYDCLAMISCYTILRAIYSHGCLVFQRLEQHVWLQFKGQQIQQISSPLSAGIFSNTVLSLLLGVQAAGCSTEQSGDFFEVSCTDTNGDPISQAESVILNGEILEGMDTVLAIIELCIAYLPVYS